MDDAGHDRTHQTLLRSKYSNDLLNPAANVVQGSIEEGAAARAMGGRLHDLMEIR